MTVPSDPADDELVRFARMVAHGLRNPLAIATGMLDLLDRQVGDQLDDEVRHLVERSSDALRRAGDLVLSLQQFTAASRAALAPRPVDLGAVVGDVAARVLAEPSTPPGTVIDVDDALPTVTADADAVARVFEALLDNATRHGASERPATVTVTATDDGPRWRIAVTDDGPGIPAEHHLDALAPGERLGRTGDGFGLGLALVRTLVHRHGGALELDEAPGGGLRVTVSWPKELPAGLLGEQAP